MSKKKKLDPVLQNYLDNCDFYIKISPCEDQFSRIGSFNLTVSSSENNVFPAHINDTVYLYVSEDPEKCFIYYEDFCDKNKKVRFWPVLCSVSYDILQGMKTCFCLSISKTQKGNTHAIDLSISVQIGKEIAKERELSHPNDKINLSLVNVVQNFTKDIILPLANEEHVQAHDDGYCNKNSFEIFYDQIRCVQKNLPTESLFCEIQDMSALTVNLRPYQIQAIKWMLKREKVDANVRNLHPLYLKVKTLDGKVIYVNKYNGKVAETDIPYKLPSNPGGILADEMGLGKTIEVLSLVLLNRRPCETMTPYQFKARSQEESLNCQYQCICGGISEDNEDDTIDYVECSKCGIWQHGSCLNYDVNEYPNGYLCPHCWVDSETVPYPSKATLIVTPASISHQWIEEITKHLSKGSLTWFSYEGVKRHNYIQPYTFASYDIVLTTHEIFRKEIDFVDLPHCKSEGGSRLRHSKKFMTVPSPLTAVGWWRVCFDEAQMVESASSKVAHLALKLSTINLWCVSGTPLQESIKDIFGLLVLLGEDPYCYQKWWKLLLYDPYSEGYAKPLLNVFASCFWRTSKKDVLDQIDIPAQTEVTHWLNFSPVEEYFYARQHEKCSSQTALNLARHSSLDLKLKHLDRHTLSIVLAPLLQLRQACCHPQVVGKGIYLPLKKKTMTMEELLESLVKKCKLECEEHHRQLISATNGLAAINIILGDVKRAVELYREVLDLEKEHSGLLKTDRVQIIHTLLNLANVLETHVMPKDSIDTEKSPSKCDMAIELIDNNSRSEFEENPYNIGRTLEDDKLRERAEELKRLYLDKYQELVDTALESLKKSRHLVTQIFSEIPSNETSVWIFEAIAHAKKKKAEDLLINRIKEFLSDKQTQASKLSKTFNSIAGLKYILVKEIDNIHNARETLSNSIEKISSTPSKEDINTAIDCHLRPSGSFVKCKYCQIHELFNEYEACLFRFKEDTSTLEPSTSEEALFTEQRRGIWADSEMEMILKCLHSFSKQLNCESSVIEQGSHHLKLLDIYKKEFRAMRAVWMNVRDFVSAVDEVEMAKLRLRLRYPDELVLETPVPYILEKSEVVSQNLQLRSDQTTARLNLKRKKGRLLYLQNLTKSNFYENGGVNPEKCPICVKELGTRWAVIQCGHCFCVDCIRILISMKNNSPKPIARCGNGRPKMPHSETQNVHCAVCRQKTPHSEICYVDSDSKSGDAIEDMEVKGSYSTKIVGIVRCLMQILKDEPKSKVIIFSTWIRVLDILGEALEQNNFCYIHISGSRKNHFQESILKFKQESEKTVLLLPLKSGANGLNLIEATHVILAEPLLNSGEEQQALGRVHRLGQTKATTVHRFIVKSTIEEQICNFLNSRNSASRKEDVEMSLNDLANLFTIPGNSVM